VFKPEVLNLLGYLSQDIPQSLQIGNSSYHSPSLETVYSQHLCK